MRSASYTDIRSRTFALLRQPGGTDVDTQDDTDFRNAFARNFRRAWQAYEWPFSIGTERANVSTVDGAVALNVRGEVMAVYADDPRTTGNARALPYTIGDTHFYILGRRPASVYVRYKLWEPEFDWEAYSEDATYEDWECAWKDGELMQFSAQTNAWTPLAIPYEFKEFLALSCAGDLARGPGDQRSGEFYALGERALDDEIYNSVRTLNRVQSLNVGTYKHGL